MEVENNDIENGVQIVAEADATVPVSQKVTTPYLTKYERARILGTRALQLSMNAPPMVEVPDQTDTLQIALEELKQKKIPLIIRRFLPSGKYEDWRLDELNFD
ncbi:DNA-directed RNA polymerases I, II, and III subunit RPABC2-like protein [Blastocystis sp. ATCC 50177/Nand II]|uniref:DNA-directed RNA polymerases I, II, and III subunit RPABC2-like protein n=1 Tax=Blastocystis sp. subtype 1 (strain ATCC 50177 / NandII) TaxID=478820 RepID=A0A196SML5_BLAHN|nr:DNA-directed RNA polymerases I, II, and III subunit RPABC2-like protein [Blastocystis sp. ATCC 50177/Nand II]